MLGAEVVDARKSRPANELVLITCYPLHGVHPLGPKRYLVYAVAAKTQSRASRR